METRQVKSVMDKANKVSPKEQNKSLCDSCGFYFDSYYVTKTKNGYNYCEGCNHMQTSALKYNEPINKEDFDKMLKMALETPPLKLKDLDIVKGQKRKAKRKDSK